MREEIGRDEHASAVNETVRDILSAIRAVRLYPPNNPLYAQSISTSHKAIERFLKTAPSFSIAIQKTGFFCEHRPLHKDSGHVTSLASDLFGKGIREIVFMPGVTEPELRVLYEILAIPLEVLRLKGSAASLLWEKGAPHIRLREAGLEDVVRASIDAAPGPGRESLKAANIETVKETIRGAELNLFGKRLLLSQILDDPKRFGAEALELSISKAGNGVSAEAMLFAAYRDASRRAIELGGQASSLVIDALVDSILSLEQGWRERLVAGMMYPALDSMMLKEHMDASGGQAVHDLHELLSARFVKSWTRQQISGLLIKTASHSEDSAPKKTDTPLPAEIFELAKQMSEYSQEEMAALRQLSDYGTEMDTLDANVFTLIQAMPYAQRAASPGSGESALAGFSRIVGILEDALVLYLDNRQYTRAALVLRSFKMPVEPMFRQRLSEAVKKAADRRRLQGLVADLRDIPKDSEDYKAVTAFLSLLDREATPVLLEILAEEDDRSVRKTLVNILKDLGKNQIALLGERLSDERWYFVRNIVGILGESRKEEAVEYLAGVAGHRNFQIRQEVVRALITIGGSRAAHMLVKFLDDRDIDIRFMATRGIGSLQIGSEAIEQALISLLKRRWRMPPSHELRLEAISSLGKAGGPKARGFLARLAKRPWWSRSRTRLAVSRAALAAIAEMERRGIHA